MLTQTESWPYNFLNSSDFPRAHQRGLVAGRLLVRDGRLARANSAFIGLAPPGTLGSWQKENKVHFIITRYIYTFVNNLLSLIIVFFHKQGYQFWTKTDDEGYFKIENVCPGDYNLYAWVPGYIGDYMFHSIINVLQGF